MQRTYSQGRCRCGVVRIGSGRTEDGSCAHVRAPHVATRPATSRSSRNQGCIDWNRSLLKKELGLEESDIIDLPILFKLPIDDLRAVAYFPDMVNMIVLGNVLGIPKPFGPIINGKCCLEKKMRSLLEPLQLDCNFIDDFASYHVQLGEVHCGSNVRREPFDFKWWNLNA